MLGGNLEKAALHAELGLKFSADAGAPFGLMVSHSARAHVMHGLGKNREAAKDLNEALKIGRKIKSKRWKYYGLMEEALFALNRGKETSCLDILRRALPIGREGGYLNMSIYQPSAMVRLCGKALEAGIEVEYVQDFILSTFLRKQRPNGMKERQRAPFNSQKKQLNYTKVLSWEERANSPGWCLSMNALEASF